MTSKEWVENFESLNGRKPTPEEYSEAMGSFFKMFKLQKLPLKKYLINFNFCYFE